MNNQNSSAAHALSMYYTQEIECSLVRQMFERAIVLGHDELLKIRRQFMGNLGELEKRRLLLENAILQFEKNEGLGTHRMTVRKRLERKVF